MVMRDKAMGRLKSRNICGIKGSAAPNLNFHNFLGLFEVFYPQIT